MNRRSVLGILAGTGLAGTAGCLGGIGSGPGETSPTPVVNRDVPPGDTNGSNPQFQGSATHTAHRDTTGPTESITTFWRRTPYRYDHSQPISVDDRVYITFAGTLFRLDRTTGESQWSTDIGHDSASTPAIYDDTVYVTVWNGGQDVDRGVAAIDANTGDVRWRGLTDADVTTSPAVTEDGVFVGGGYETPTVAGFDHDGTERWRHTLGEYASTPAVSDGRVYYGAGDPYLVAYDAESGDQQWRTDTDGETTVAPTVIGDLVVAGTDAGTLYAVDKDDGSEVWTTALSSGVRHSVAVSGDRVIVPLEENVVAVNRDGVRQWEADAITDPTAPVVAGRGVYCGDGKTIRMLAVDDGTERWSFETRERSYTDVQLRGIRSPPTVTNGVVLVATQAGDLYALGEE